LGAEVEEEITPRTFRDDDEKEETEDGTLFPPVDDDDSDDDDADIPESARICVA
jgi:hypothetical protein